MTSPTEMAAVIEAILFTATEPVPRERLLAVFDPAEAEAATAALAEVLARHREEADRGVMLEEVAGGLRLATRPELASWLRRFYEAGGATKLSMAALETLAIVAYRQPITGPEIQDLRGVSAVGVLKTLLERRLVRISGRKQVVGKPFLYGTTREFLMHFGLKGLEDLPPLEEFEETFGEGGGLGAPRLTSVSLTAAGFPASEAPAAFPVVAAAEAPFLEADRESDREERIRQEAAAIEDAEADLMSAETGDAR
jgi:segregation and condensation protein B